MLKVSNWIKENERIEEQNRQRVTNGALDDVVGA